MSPIKASFLTGKVEYNAAGNNMKKGFNRVCCAIALILLSNASNALTVQVQDTQGKPLHDIVVYAEPLDGQAMGKTDKKVIISQAKKSFTPYVSVAQTGNKLEFLNQDDITHHVYSANTKRKFAFLIRPGQKVAQPALSSANEIVMGCNVHDWMSGYLLVLDTPYFDKTNQQGEVTLDIQGGGRYKIIAWHPQLNEQQHRVSQQVDMAKTDTLTLKLTQKMLKIPEQKSDGDFDFLSDY